MVSWGDRVTQMAMEMYYGAQPQATTTQMENGEIVTSLNVSDMIP
jgi:hypothetical protein